MSPKKKPVTGKAHAKINLTFEVLDKRPDGYHEIISVMQAISLCDVLTFEPYDDVRLVCDISEMASPNNLVYRAAMLMQGLARQRHGVSISLSKGIPVASGMGGGSSDAAMTLQILNKLWGVNLPQRRLIEVAAQLGSDVPFFVSGHPTALATGRGDKLEALPSAGKTWLVLLRPPIEIASKTREMYARLDRARYTGGQHGQSLAEAIRAGQSITNRRCFNVFDSSAPTLFPGLESYRHEFLAAGARDIHLAGAGPALFTLASGKKEGMEIYRRLKSRRMEAYLAETL